MAQTNRLAMGWIAVAAGLALLAMLPDVASAGAGYKTVALLLIATCTIAGGGYVAAGLSRSRED